MILLDCEMSDKRSMFGWAIYCGPSKVTSAIWCLGLWGVGRTCAGPAKEKELGLSILHRSIRILPLIKDAYVWIKGS